MTLAKIPDLPPKLDLAMVNFLRRMKEHAEKHGHDAVYAPIAKGVTNGDSHNHVGGDGAQIDHGGLAGLGDDDHSIYVKADGTRVFSVPLVLAEQPAALVGMSTDMLILTSSAEKIPFDTEITDRGNDFDTTSCNFTAPVGGLYLVTVNLVLGAVDTAATSIFIRINTSNRNYDSYIDPKLSADATYFPWCVTQIVDMDQNDVVKIATRQSGGAEQVYVLAVYSFFGVWFLG